MPLDEAAGEISLSEENLRVTLAACASFQALCNVTSATAALDRVHLCGLPGPQPNPDGTIPDSFKRHHLEQLRPFGLIYARPNAGTVWARTAHPNTIEAAGVLRIELERTVPADQAKPAFEPQVERQWKNFVGQIAEELLEFYTHPYLILERVQMVELWRVHPDEVHNVGDFQCALLEVRYNQRRVA
jgi:hypothetical protein